MPLTGFGIITGSRGRRGAGRGPGSGPADAGGVVRARARSFISGRRGCRPESREVSSCPSQSAMTWCPRRNAARTSPRVAQDVGGELLGRQGRAGFRSGRLSWFRRAWKASRDMTRRGGRGTAVGRLSGVLGEPVAQYRRGRLVQRGAAFLPALSRAVHVGSGTEADVVAGEAGELGDAQPGAQGGEDHRVVAAADPGGAVAGAQQRAGLGIGEPADSVRVAGSRRWPGPAGSPRRPQVPAARRNGTASGSPRAARCGCEAVVPVVTRWSQEARDQAGRPARPGASSRGGAGRCCAKRAAAGRCPGMRRRCGGSRALGDQPVGEKGLQDRGERRSRAPWARGGLHPSGGLGDQFGRSGQVPVCVGRGDVTERWTAAACGHPRPGRRGTSRSGW